MWLKVKCRIDSYILISGGKCMLDKIIHILMKYTEVDKNEIDENKDLSMDLHLDSLDVANIVGDIENTFAVSISDEELWSIHSIADICYCIEQKLNEV